MVFKINVSGPGMLAQPQRVRLRWLIVVILGISLWAAQVHLARGQAQTACPGTYLPGRIIVGLTGNIPLGNSIAAFTVVNQINNLPVYTLSVPPRR